MRIHLDMKLLLGYIYELGMGEPIWIDPEKFPWFRFEMHEYIKKLLYPYEGEIRNKCLEKIISEGLNLSESELKVLLETRMNMWIRERAKKEIDKAVRMWERSSRRLVSSDGYYMDPKEREAPWDVADEILEIPPEKRHIFKNGLDVHIRGVKTSYCCAKYGTVYEIDQYTNPWWSGNKTRRETIVRECSEAWLHVDWILRILQMPKDDRRRVAYLARKLGFDVCQTPRSKLKTAETIRILDEDEMFLIDVPNPFMDKGQSFDGMG